ncbi:MAG: hypothetical protein QW594_02110 [Candidatus Woesearchaeota archaeon]
MEKEQNISRTQQESVLSTKDDLPTAGAKATSYQSFQNYNSKYYQAISIDQLAQQAKTLAVGESKKFELSGYVADKCLSNRIAHTIEFILEENSNQLLLYMQPKEIDHIPDYMISLSYAKKKKIPVTVGIKLFALPRNGYEKKITYYPPQIYSVFPTPNHEHEEDPKKKQKEANPQTYGIKVDYCILERTCNGMKKTYYYGSLQRAVSKKQELNREKT